MSPPCRTQSSTGLAEPAGGVIGAQIEMDDFDRKVVKTAELGIRAEDVRRGAATAQEVVALFGGSIISSQIYRADDSAYADLVISVPSREF